MQSRHQGVALVAVLWMVAALSVLALGLAATARTEVRSAQGVRDRALAAALGDAAIQLAVLELRSSAEGYEDYREATYLLGDREITVTAAPAGGLVDLNQASEELLAGLFLDSGELEPEQAAELARRVVARSAGGRRRLCRRRRGLPAPWRTVRVPRGSAPGARGQLPSLC